MDAAFITLHDVMNKINDHLGDNNYQLGHLGKGRNKSMIAPHLTGGITEFRKTCTSPIHFTVTAAAKFWDGNGNDWYNEDAGIESDYEMDWFRSNRVG